MSTRIKAGFYTLGCKLNFAETATLIRRFDNAGYGRAGEWEKADIYVINTCSVTENANKNFRALVRRLHKINPDAVIIATGCYAQLEPETLAEIEQVDMVVGMKDKLRIADFITHVQKKSVADIHSCETRDLNIFDPAYSTGERTRAFLKIQDGCDYVCTYCTIPGARGKSRSGSIESILDNARNIARQGIGEIVLTGVNIGDYGKNISGNAGYGFLDLIKKLDTVEGIARYRISSIEPNLLTSEIIEFVAGSEKFVPHFHIPLQSGNDTLLKTMKRRYRTADYRDRVETVKKLIPHAAIGVDVIVGFPGETDEKFLDTYRFIESLDVSYLHVFTYSERPGTPAATMEGKVPVEVRRKRSKMLRALSLKKKQNFYRSQMNTEHTVIFEPADKEGYQYGFTGNYIRVRLPASPSLSKNLQRVKLSHLENGLFTGTLLS